MDIFIFEAAGHYVAIEAQYVYRVADNVDIVPVPLVPDCYEGLLYYRGDLFDVVDMGRLLEKDAAVLHDDPCIILLKWDTGKLGLIPDRILGMRWVDGDNGSPVIIGQEGNSAKLMAPEEIWKRLAELSYGA